jgi:cyclophilin family peptidyl-prolyl cis-trans isomerase/HEAT repeat protein
MKPHKQPASKTHLRSFHSHAGASAICALVLALSASVFSQSRSQVLHNPTSFTAVPRILLLRIVRAEDERRWDKDVRDLLSARSAVVRSRAALAAGRIGNEDSVADLVKLLQHDDETDVRAMAAFALGEVESASAAEALLGVLSNTKEPLVRARAVEALGKIAAALPKEQEGEARQLGDGILDALKFESGRRAAPDRLSVLLGLTAALRARTSNGGPTIAKFLNHVDPRIRSDAANTLARLRLKDGNEQLRKLLVGDPDPAVRANAARVLGGTDDKASFDALLDRALQDKDSRVRVSAIRALASLKDKRAAVPLLQRSKVLAKLDLRTQPPQVNEVLELAAALGRILQGTGDKETLSQLRQFVGFVFNHNAPEIDIAFARISAGDYLAFLGASATRTAQQAMLVNWRAGSGTAQGLGEIASLPETTQNRAELAQAAENILRAMLDYRNSGITINTLVAVHSEYAIPDVLRAFAAHKPKDLGSVLRKHLQESEVVIRATAAELLGELPPDEANARALIDALPVALQDKELNDAALAILDSLAKQKTSTANEAIRTALESPDHLIRRKAVALLKANGAGDFSSRIGTVQTRHTSADYERAIARIGKTVSAVVTTSKGAFTIQLLPDDAPLTVDNFVQLAKRSYFAGITIHRVVPNFVIQDGDPRGDGNGGPGYQIRCEINQVPYERGAIGMALSGKDTGGSQWFATHSPQPHLDGGYTVFGKVVFGMDVVDNIVRGDVIRSIVIKEKGRSSTR